MAVNVNNAERSSTIAFTLPISCQICLGKVKYPLLCPNNHVFCSPCMEVWLERNKQCPACRTPINDENPCREIRGGVSMVDEEDRGSMNTPELRRARFEMLFKDYEVELSHTQAKMEALKVENTALKQQLEMKASAKSYAAPQIKEPDIDALAVITKKLEDVKKQYEKEVGKMKKANAELKDENDLLVRENQRLRMEISSRSPHRYGRSTVAALQSQIDSYEKEVHQLNKALQKSDGYIEELEEELSELRGTESQEGKTLDYKSQRTSDDLQTKPVQKQSHKKKLFMNSEETDSAVVAQSSSESLSRDSAKISEKQSMSVTGILVNNDSKDSTKPADSPMKGSKKVTFALPEETPPNSKMSSFDLEMPSPFSQSSGDPDSKETTPSIVVPSSASFALENQRKREENIKSVPKENYCPDKQVNSVKASVKSSSRQGVASSSRGLNDTLDIESELDELDISVTPELRDCMKLFSMAERKVQERNSLGGNVGAKPSEDSPLEQPSPVFKATKNKSIKEFEQNSASSRNDFQTVSSERSNETFSTNPNGDNLNSDVSDQKSTILSSVNPRSYLSASLDSYRPPSIQSSSASLGSSLRTDYSASGVDRVTSDRHLFSRNTVAGDSCAPCTSDRTGLSGSVVSQVLRSTPQFSLPSAPVHKFSMNSGMFLLSQSLSNPSITTSAPVNPALFGPHGVTNSSSQLGTSSSTSSNSLSLITSSESADSLTSSLLKLEQTLAAHRASNQAVPRQTSYPPLSQTGAVVPGVGEHHITSTSTYSLAAIAPPLPSASIGQSSLKPLPFSSGSHLPSFPPVGNAPRSSSLGPLSYPSAVSVSNNILYGQSTASTTGFHPGGSGQTGFSGWTTQTGMTQPNSYSAPGQASIPFSHAGLSKAPGHLISSSLPSEKVSIYSYVSNSSLNSNSSTLDGSFLPEPKKRLFETDTDDTDMSFSPLKSSKLSF